MSRIYHVPLKRVVEINPEVWTESTPASTLLAYIDISSVNGDGEISNIQLVPFGESPSRARRIVRRDDVILSTVRTYLRGIAHYRGGYHNPTASTGFAVLRPRERLVARFLYFWCTSDVAIQTICARSVGVSYPAINPEEIGRLRFPLLPIPEQQAIADFLDEKTRSIDALISKSDAISTLLGESRRTLSSNAFRVNHEAVGIRTRLMHVCSSIQTGPFGSQLSADEYVSDGVPVINPAQIQGGEIAPDRMCTVSESTAARLERHSLRSGDVVLGRRGEMGRCAVIKENQSGWLCGTGSLRLRPELSRIIPEYLHQYLSTPSVRYQLEQAAIGSTIDNLNSVIAGRLSLTLPPLAEQERQLGRLAAKEQLIRSACQALERQVAALREYRTALITAAVTGQIDVTSPKAEAVCP